MGCSLKMGEAPKPPLGVPIRPPCFVHGSLRECFVDDLLGLQNLFHARPTNILHASTRSDTGSTLVWARALRNACRPLVCTMSPPRTSIAASNFFTFFFWPAQEEQSVHDGEQNSRKGHSKTRRVGAVHHACAGNLRSGQTRLLTISLH